MSDIYWYEDMVYRTVVVGERGGIEVTLDWKEAGEIEWKLFRRLGRKPNPEEFLQFAYKFKTVEAQYIDFEEVKPEIKLLS